MRRNQLSELHVGDPITFEDYLQGGDIVGGTIIELTKKGGVKVFNHDYMAAHHWVHYPKIVSWGKGVSEVKPFDVIHVNDI